MASKNKSGWLKWLIAFMVVGAIGVGGVWYYLHKKSENVPQYQTAPVARGELVKTVTATGQLNPVLNVQVGSQISGRISKLNADFNSSVTQGQVIAEIDPSTYKAAVLRAEADLASARASLELAQVETRRNSNLFTNNLLSASDYDNSIASLHQAEAAVQIKQAALDSAQVDLSRCTIYSPVDGTVISRNVDVGQTVAASLSAPVLFQIANDLTKMQIDANVAEADVGGVEVAQDVEFTVDAFPYRTFHGKVIQVRNAPTTVQNVVTYDAVIEVNNSDLKLKPGMTANVAITIQRREDVLRIPNAALRFRPPETVEMPKLTNATAQAEPARTNSVAATGGGERGERGERGGRRGGQGGQGERGRGGGNHGDHPVIRTIFTLPAGAEDATTDRTADLKPVQVRLGISDGLMTEVTAGLKEGDLVVTGVTRPDNDGQSSQGNPFGGGGRGFRRF